MQIECLFDVFSFEDYNIIIIIHSLSLFQALPYNHSLLFFQFMLSFSLIVVICIYIYSYIFLNIPISVCIMILIIMFSVMIIEYGELIRKDYFFPTVSIPQLPVFLYIGLRSLGFSNDHISLFIIIILVQFMFWQSCW